MSRFYVPRRNTCRLNSFMTYLDWMIRCVNWQVIHRALYSLIFRITYTEISLRLLISWNEGIRIDCERSLRTLHRESPNDTTACLFCRRRGNVVGVTRRRHRRLWWKLIQYPRFPFCGRTKHARTVNNEVYKVFRKIVARETNAMKKSRLQSRKWEPQT